MAIPASASINAFERVRTMPYAIDAAHDAPSLRTRGRGNCAAKAELLAEELTALGHIVRIVRWEYRLPRLVDAMDGLGFSTDVHTTLQVLVDARWQLVDPTHDPALADLGLTVGHWDGQRSTPPAYAPIGAPWVRGRPADDHAWALAVGRITTQVQNTSAAALHRYQRDLTDLLESTRR